MANEFNGTWTSMVFGAHGPTFEADFDLTENATGDKLDGAKSKHGGNNVSGEIMARGNRRRIHIVDDQAATPAEYFGVLIDTFPLANGKTLYIIAGVMRLTSGVAHSRGKKLAGDQEQGTWVATKQG